VNFRRLGDFQPLGDFQLLGIFKKNKNIVIFSQSTLLGRIFGLWVIFNFGQFF
jgi:hypothetical protein